MPRITKLEMQGFKSFAKKTQILFPSNFSIIAGPNGSGKCLSGESKIILSDGRMEEIGDIVEAEISKSSNIEKIDDGFISHENAGGIKVISLDPETLKLEERKVSAFAKRSAPEFLLNIKTRSGKEITATPYHPFFSLEKCKLKNLKAEDIRVGVRIAVPRNLPITNKNQNFDILGILKKFSEEDGIYIPYSESLKDFMKILKNEIGTAEKLAEKSGVDYFAVKGVFDGQSISASNFCRLISINGFLPKEIENVANSIKGKTTPKIVKMPKQLDEPLARFLGYFIAEGSCCTEGQVRFVNDDTALIEDFCLSSKHSFGLNPKIFSYKGETKDVIIFSETLKKLLDKVFEIKINEVSKEKKVPLQIFESSDNVAAAFLSALFEGDAHVCLKEGKKTQAYIEYCTASEQLAKGVSNLLLRLGITSSIRKKSKYASNTKAKKKRDYYSVYIYGYENLMASANKLKFLGRKKEKIEKMKVFLKQTGTNVDFIPNVSGEIKSLSKLCGIKIKKIKKICPRLQAYYENRCEVSRHGLKEVLGAIEKFGKVTDDAKEKAENLRLLTTSDIFWDEIISVEKIAPKDKWVYDLCVEGTHNFVAENFIVHNSNVLDAIVFVLGRTSAKSIRADKMLEVIFNGSKKSPPSEFASVKIHFDNKDKKFPVEVDEIEIGRKVNRKGVSIYKLNGQTSTREKILEVLRAAHINPDGHNIILQGDVTNVIEMSDLERREIIDDISGISEFEDKREKANKELMTVEERLDTTSVILGERENQMKKLQEEAKSAVEFNELSKELDKLRASLAARRLGEAAEAMKILEEKISEKEKETKTSEAEVSAIDSEMDKTQKEFSTLTEKTISRAGDVSIIKEAEKLRAEIYAKKNKIESSEFDIKRIDDVIGRLKEIAERALTESASGAVQAVLKLNRTGIYGTIAQLSKVPQNFQTAIEVCAGPHMHDLVVGDSSVAVDCVNYLKQNRVGRATFLPLDKIRERNPEHVRKFLKQPGVVGLAIDLIQFDKKYWHAFSHIFGDTLVVDKIETARRLGIGEARMVTLDGDLVERGGAIIGGFYRSDKKVFSVAEDFSKYEREKERILRESENLQIEIEKLSRELEKLSQKEQAGGKEVSEMQAGRADAEKTLHSLRLRRKEAFEHKLNLGEEINKLKISRARFEAELENIKAEFANYKQELAEYKEMPAGTLATKIHQTVAKVSSLGPINQKAIEELEEIKKGFSELKEKFDVLTAERERVVRMILEIESSRKETFMRTFSAVSQQFKNVYKDLTGGDGFLSLDNEQIDEAGLIIEAVPAGKKKINIDSMSGGEKTMVALAFLFALQRFRPSPFYILDEIDAALDKPNARRVVDLIKKYSDNAQFVVISHNETTIQEADCVYGVSMDEGESKMVGIRMPA